nr:DUF3828 domain-containing protein [uncultured Flavobacterium sp.]
MKTKISVAIIIFVMTFFNMGNAQTILAEKNSYDKQIVEMLKKFYNEYLIEVEKMPLNQRKVNLIKQKFCTSKLLSKIDLLELDYDPFVNAQDFDSEVLKTIKFTKDSKNLNVYKACYVYSFNKKNICIKLQIIKVNGNFKIDDIIGLK